MNHRPLAMMCLLLAMCTMASAQSSWGDRTYAGEFSFAQGDFERAEKEFQAALDLAQGFPQGDLRLETSLENMARFYEHMMDMDRAQPLFQLLLVAREARVGDESPALLDTLAAIGRVGIGSGDVPTSVDAFERYIEIAERTGEADPGQHAVVLILLARSYVLQERGAEGLELQRKAVALLADNPGTTDLERADAMESLAQMDLMHGTGDDAERLLTEVIALREAEGEGGGGTYVLAKASETALANANLDVADALAERAIEVAESEEDSEAARSTAQKVLADSAWMRVRRGATSMEDLLLAAGDTPELQAASRRVEGYALQLEGDPAADPQRLATTVSRLARIYALRGLPKDAEFWLRKELELAPTALDAGRSEEGIREDLVILCLADGRREDAVRENAALISAIERDQGVESPRLLSPLERQRELLTELKRRKEARAVKKRIKKLKKKF